MNSDLITQIELALKTNDDCFLQKIGENGSLFQELPDNLKDAITSVGHIYQQQSEIRQKLATEDTRRKFVPTLSELKFISKYLSPTEFTMAKKLCVKDNLKQLANSFLQDNSYTENIGAARALLKFWNFGLYSEEWIEFLSMLSQMVRINLKREISDTPGDRSQITLWTYFGEEIDNKVIQKQGAVVQIIRSRMSKYISHLEALLAPIVVDSDLFISDYHEDRE